MRRGIDYYILLFFSTSFIGWIWEVLLYLYLTGGFINRGVYYGPYLPIYGFGCVGMCLVLKRYRDNWIKSFLGAVTLCTALEYVSSWYLEKKWGYRWWDYSERFCNVNGRVCLMATLGFGIGGMLFNCFYLKHFERWYSKRSPRILCIISMILALMLLVDAVYCAIHPHVGYGISD